MGNNGKNMHQLIVKRQGGAALVVALVLLAAITIVGVSNMQSTMLEMKMVTSTMDRNRAFSIAEGALLEAESILENSLNLNFAGLHTDDCSSNCFTSTCNDGLCFDGEFENNDPAFFCSISPSADTSARTFFWRDESLDVWETAGKHRIVNVGLNQVKYIIEFLCFVDDGNGNFGVSDPTAGDPLFRITVFVEGEGGLSPVMLQSTYSFPL